MVLWWPFTCLKQGALVPQAGNGREYRWVWSVTIPTSSDTPDRTSWQQNPTGAWEGGEVGSLLIQGLSPEYQQMLAHKVRWWKSCHLFQIATYCLEARKMGGSQRILCSPKNHYCWEFECNIASHSQGNLFPSRKLKGNCTFTAQSTAVEDHETEEDSGPKPDGEKEGWVLCWGRCGNDMGSWQCRPIVRLHCAWFANAVELYQKKNHNCFWCGSPDHLVKDCPKEMGKTARKVGLNLKEGMAKKGGQSSQTVGGYPRGHPGWCSLSIKMSRKAAFLNPDHSHWSGPET